MDTKCVCVVERKPDASVEQYKARKVGRGFTLVHAINYDSDKTFSQMIRPETFKTLLVIALFLDLDIRQWDVDTADLQATLKHDIYISDINEDGETEYWLLDKGLYGLMQSGYKWYEMLISNLREIGFD